MGNVFWENDKHEAQHRYFNSHSPKSENWLNLPRSPLYTLYDITECLYLRSNNYLYNIAVIIVKICFFY